MGFETAGDQKTDKKGLSLSEVKSAQDRLECSPSCKQSTSNYGGKAKIIRHSGSNASGSISGELTVGKKRR